jgi:hypothetical protein
MNVNLSIDEQVVERARKKADALGKNLNQLVRDYLQKLAGGDDPERSIEEFKRLSRKRPFPWLALQSTRDSCKGDRRSSRGKPLPLTSALYALAAAVLGSEVISHSRVENGR